MIKHVPGQTARLEIHVCDQRRSYWVVFTREEDALEFINRKTDMNHAFFEDIDDRDPDYRGVPESWTDLLDVLYPTCVHGMSAALCEDPIDHYGPDRDYV